MAYLIIGSSRSYCSCDQRSNVDPRATGHYMNYAPDYHKSAEPCNQPWDYYVTPWDYYVTTYGSLVSDEPVEYVGASVPWRSKAD